MHRFALFVLVVGCGDNADTEPPADSSPIVPRCVPADVRADLSAYATALSETAALMTEAPGPAEAIGFYRFPRLGNARALVEAACATPGPQCGNDSVCARTECTADGWTLHLSTTTPVGDDPVYATTAIDTTWTDGDTKVTFEIAATSQSGTHDWSLSGTGELEVGAFSAEITFPSLVENSTLVFGASGTDGSLVSTVRFDGEPTELCD